MQEGDIHKKCMNCTCMHAFVHSCMQACTHKYIHTHTHSLTHAHIHICICMYIFQYICWRGGFAVVRFLFGLAGLDKQTPTHTAHTAPGGGARAASSRVDGSQSTRCSGTRQQQPRQQRTRHPLHHQDVFPPTSPCSAKSVCGTAYFLAAWVSSSWTQKESGERTADANGRGEQKRWID